MQDSASYLGLSPNRKPRLIIGVFDFMSLARPGLLSLLLIKSYNAVTESEFQKKSERQIQGRRLSCTKCVNFCCFSGFILLKDAPPPCIPFPQKAHKSVP
ncbi:hypothetical protein D4R78_05515 [bacterium]|nr:MAG: hypothetical protein D4R78_05515 [bacterium]